MPVPDAPDVGLRQSEDGLSANASSVLSPSDFQPGLRINLHHKDMGLVTTVAREAGVTIPQGSLIAPLVAAPRAEGGGGLDHSPLLRGVQRTCSHGGRGARRRLIPRGGWPVVADH